MKCENCGSTNIGFTFENPYYQMNTFVDSKNGFDRPILFCKDCYWMIDFLTKERLFLSKEALYPIDTLASYYMEKYGKDFEKP